ncbi:MAG: response regulator [Myxococcales bacterium]|jgi:CheY-like chemotaxis protein|nr:response regulator [Myxococcales bacterium]MBK7191505.1 response regulator [Myxococcales bacterium]MBP6849505.1 response regulator [Kofleriaceae bacterium]
MTRQPIRRALSIELASEPTSRSAGSAGGARRAWRVGRLRVVQALAPMAMRQVVSGGLRALALEPHRVATFAGLLDAVARDPDVVLLSDPFDRVSGLATIATLRTAGYDGAIVVLGHAARALRTKQQALGHVTLLPDPITGATVAGPWLRRCLAVANPLLG